MLATPFLGTFSSGDLSAWPVQQGVDGDIAVVPDPLGSGAWRARLAVEDADTAAPPNPSGNYVNRRNPAAALIGPAFQFTEGVEAFVSWRVLFPSSFPAIAPGSWFQWAELHGPSTVNGKDAWIHSSPATGLDVEVVNGVEQIGLWRGVEYGYDHIWTAPLVRGRWQRVVLHCVFSADPALGFWELWHQGRSQVLGAGRTRLYGQTLQDPTQHLAVYADNYRPKGVYPGTVTIYHGAVKVGDTLGSVL